ncbi:MULTISPECIES: hypothetical protein [Streptomyces]|uniref:hypothetical protein n=1 Tax=Streptomyces TaxID=1883 RepID=UPI0005BD7854|nr:MULTISPECIES: hypothetical protein [Streptomyces]MDP9949108.1 hypothetical protein [Streptomyces sp. DSM 41269]
MAWLLTLGVAFVVSLLQTWLRLVSREPRPGKKHALTIDDAVFWIDWIVTAAVAFCGALLAASLEGKAIDAATVATALVAIILGLTFMPFGVRMVCYDGSGVIKGWMHVAVANVAGLLVLLSSVVAGVKTYA